MTMSPTVAYAGHLTAVIPDERPFGASADITVGDTDLRPTDSNKAFRRLSSVRFQIAGPDHPAPRFNVASNLFRELLRRAGDRLESQNREPLFYILC